MLRALATAAAVAAFLLAVLGSWVRINGAGMTCPDWPLCHGVLVPAFDGGVILEWSHRAVALAETILVTATLVTGWRVRHTIAGITQVLVAIGLALAVQVVLGGLTVALGNSPWSVVWHWGTAMAFLAALVTLAVLATVRPAPGTLRPHAPFVRLLAATALAAFAAMCAGAYVSSSGAGLACATFPACDGAWFATGLGQSAHMVHRALAGVFFLLATVAAYATSLGAPLRVRVATLFGYALIVVQVMLGLANVAWALPTILREAHAANAAATFLAFVAATVFATVSAPARSTAPHPTRQPVVV